MNYTFVDTNQAGKFLLFQVRPGLEQIYQKQGGDFTFHAIFYNNGKEAKINIDGVDYKVPPKSLLPLAFNQSFKWEECEDVIGLQFNRDFYCIVNHDKEVGCVGFLFFGPISVMLIDLKEDEQETINNLYRLFVEELERNQEIKGEMLRTALTKLIIFSTRLAKKKYLVQENVSDEKFKVIRDFNLLVEIHFRKEHSVTFYADKLNKSPKTLSNTFSQHINKTPLQLINERIINEAQRLLYYTDKSIKEVAQDLGFEEATHFSKFYKNHTSLSPKDDKLKFSGN